MTQHDPMSPDQLTTHEAFLKRIARALVSDGPAADDLVQEAYAAALERAPDAPGNLRAWMAGVVRNKARMRARSRARRSRREAVVAPTGATPATAELLAKEEARQRVLAAVLALPEAYREVILLRYMEDKPPRQIARELGLPVETVRTRLWRARDRLREDLDREGGGKAGAGLALLAPWLGAGATTTSFGLALGALVVAGALLVGVFVWRPWSAPAPEEPVLESADAGGDAKRNDGPVLEPQGVPVPAPMPAPATVTAPPPVPGKVLHGRVQVYAPMQQGLAPATLMDGATITAWVARPRTAFAAEAEERKTKTFPGQWTTSGRFEVRDLPEGAYVVEVRQAGFIPGRAIGQVDANDGFVKILMQSTPSDAPTGTTTSYTVRVQDSAGRAVEDAQVTCIARTGAASMQATTDAKGQATFDDLPFMRFDEGGGHSTGGHDIAFGFVTARKDGRVARQPFGVWRFAPGREPPALVLDEPGTLRGRLTLPKGQSARALSVRATILMGKSGMWGPRGSPVTAVVEDTAVAEDGTYRFDDLPPGGYFLTLRSSDGLRIDRRHATLGTNADRRVDPAVAAYASRVAGGARTEPKAAQRNDALPVKVLVKGGEETVRDLAVIAGVTLQGTVQRDGRPVADVRVDVEFAPHDRLGVTREPSPDGLPSEMLGRRWTDPLRNPLSWTTVRTDAAGRYTLHGLAPDGRYFVRVHPQDDQSFDQRFVETGPAGSTTDVTHALTSAGSATITVRSHLAYALRHGDDERSAYAFQPTFSETGIVHVPGLRPGRWRLIGYAPYGSRSAPELASFQVKAGETTVVNALRAGDCLVRGRVSRRGSDVAGAIVWIPGVKASRVRTDASGRFEIRFPSSVQTHGVGVAVEAPDAASPIVRKVSGEVLRGGIPPGWTWDVDIELPQGSLDIEVTDEAGRPAASAAVEVRRVLRGRPSGVIMNGWIGRTDAHGRVAVRGIQLDGCLISATLAGTKRIARAWIEEDPHAQESVRIQVGAPSRVLVRVVDDAGMPRTGVSIGSRFWDAGMPADTQDPRQQQLGRPVPSRGSVLTDERGEAHLKGLSAGTLELYASMRGGHVTKRIVLEAGRDVTIELVLMPQR